jgi:hypothetical protein
MLYSSFNSPTRRLPSCAHIWTCVLVCWCRCVGTCVRMHVVLYTHVRAYVFMYVGMYVCTYICMYVRTQFLTLCLVSPHTILTGSIAPTHGSKCILDNRMKSNLTFEFIRFS